MKLTKLLSIFVMLAATNLDAAMAPEALARYQADLDTLATELPTRHANLFHTTSKETFDRAVADLHQAMPTMDEKQALVALTRITALAGDGHTALFLLPFPGGAPIPGVRQLPIQFYTFDDGVRVIAVDKVHSNLLGARLTMVGDVPVDELRRRVIELVPYDNDMGKAEYLAWYLALPDVLNSIGAAPDRSKVRLTLDHDGESWAIDLQPMAAAPDAGWATQLITLPGARTGLGRCG
jgi:hypothetical protein